jgi:hypothetical protein
LRSRKLFDEVADPSIRVYVPLEKKLKFKTICSSKGLVMTDVINELIDQWIAENDAPSIPAPNLAKRDKGGEE